MSYTAAVLTISDKGSRGERVDTSGPALVKMLEEAGYEVKYTTIIPDEREMIKEELVKCADELGIALILTTGGTGFSPRDITPEATLEVIEREVRGIPELMRAESCKITDKGCLSRAVCGIRGRSLILNLPGSEKAAKENFAAVVSPLGHGMDMLYSAGSADCGEPAHEHHHHHH
ncbi:MAG: MogA/MoaB family molybdenum cofactor biosynthesis protein [Lachnospiraceae bacterium]|nr:MogA/MoaB family molybdenum cofactor biosynthesis protein [Lachnospiraceae bacterium]